MNKKVCAGAAAAVLIGAGTLFVTDSPENDVQEFPEIQAIKVSLPEIQLPQVQTLSVNLPAIEQMPRSAPELKGISVQMFEQPVADSLKDPLPEKNFTSPEISVSLPVVADPVTEIPKVIEHENRIRNIFRRDQRNVSFDPGLRYRSTHREKWEAIYNDPSLVNYKIDFVQLEKGLRIITEITAPENTKEFLCMQERLTFFRKWGYNAVLVTFDTSEDLAMLRLACSYIRSQGMKIILAYSGGHENLNDSVFRDPDRIRTFLQDLLPEADAFLLGWRRTSLHLFLPDDQYTNWFLRTVRSITPDLPVIGQAYYGQTAETSAKDAAAHNFKTTYCIPENVSAVMVVGLGYPNVSNQKAFQTIFPEIRKNEQHIIAVVVGEKPYADTINSTGRTYLQNMKIKRRIELQLLQFLDSTMTYSGDGSFGIHNPDYTDNLCKKYGGEKK